MTTIHDVTAPFLSHQAMTTIPVETSRVQTTTPHSAAPTASCHINSIDNSRLRVPSRAQSWRQNTSLRVLPIQTTCPVMPSQIAARLNSATTRTASTLVNTHDSASQVRPVHPVTTNRSAPGQDRTTSLHGASRFTANQNDMSRLVNIRS